MLYYETMKLGKPTKYKHKFDQIAYDLLSKGYSKEAVAGQIGISKQCFYEWVQKYDHFGDAVERGESASRYYWENVGMRGTLGELKGFNASSWMFNMKNRFGWAEKSDQNISGPPIQFLEVSFADAMDYYANKKVKRVGQTQIDVAHPRSTT